MGIDLSGREAGMTQQLFDGIQVCPPVQHVRGKGVPKHMGALPKTARHLHFHLEPLARLSLALAA